MAGETELSFRIFGTPGAKRLVVIVGAGDTATIDPSPTLTAARDIRVLAVALTGAALDDPGTFVSETPAEQTADALADLIREQLSVDRNGGAADAGSTVGMLAYRTAGDVALRAATTLGGVVDRLALVAVPMPRGPLDRDDLSSLIADVSAKTLIMNGQFDSTASSAAAGWFKDHLSSSRVEMVPDSDALSLGDVWDRLLSHLAPGTKR